MYLLQMGKVGKGGIVGLMSIHISKRTAEALSKIGMGDFYIWEPKERMAYVVLVLKKLPDSADIFPAGKSATIQHIEYELDKLAIDFLTQKKITCEEYL